MTYCYLCKNITDGMIRELYLCKKFFQKFRFSICKTPFVSNIQKESFIFHACGRSNSIMPRTMILSKQNILLIGFLLNNYFFENIFLMLLCLVLLLNVAHNECIDHMTHQYQNRHSFGVFKLLILFTLHLYKSIFFPRL